MRRYAVSLTGTSPLLMHADNIPWRDEIQRFMKDPLKKKDSKAGDDRTPAFRWIGCLYHDGKNIGLPSDNLMICIRDGASMIFVPGSTKKTYKRQSQSGIIVNELLWPITVDGKVSEWKDVADLQSEMDFHVHEETAKRLGFELFVKSAKIGQSKHIRVRPRFDKWAATGTVTVTVFDDTITTEVLDLIFTTAGMYCGMCDWRPKGKTPGQFGKFTAIVKAVA